MRHPDGADGYTLAQHRCDHDRAVAAVGGQFAGEGCRLRIIENVANLQQFAVENRLATEIAAIQRYRVHLAKVPRVALFAVRHQMNAVRPHFHHPHQHRIEQALGAGDNGVENRLRIGDRAADGAQDFAGGGLLLQGFAQFAGAVIDLALQPRIGFLEIGGHGVELVGQGFELVAGAHHDLLVEVAGADLRRAILQRADRLHHAPRQEHAGKHRD